MFPIMRIVGVRRSLIERHSWHAASVTKAFTAAKALADVELREVVAPKIGLPWVAAEYEETVRMMGRDFSSYGVAMEGSPARSNRPTLEAMSRYVLEQGLVARPISVPEMFAPTTYHEVRI